MELSRLLEWEWLGQLESFEVKESGPLPAGVTQGRLMRDSDMRICFVGHGELTRQGLNSSLSRAFAREYPNAPVVGHCEGMSVKVDGILDGKPSFSFQDQRVDFSGHFREAFKTALDVEPASHVEWVLGLKFPAMAPLRTDRRFSQTTVRSREDGQSIKKDSESEGWSYDFCSLRTDRDQLIRFGVVAAKMAPEEECPGFVEFEFIPNEEEKRAWLEVISFALGKRLYSVGWSRFDKLHNPVAMYAQDPGPSYRRRERQGDWARIPSSDFVQGGWIDGDRLGEILCGLWKVVREFDLVHTLGLYWYGCSAPLDVAPVILGSSIESLRDSFLGEKRPKYVADRGWSLIRKHLLVELEKVGAELRKGEILRAEALDAFRASIDRMNDVSVSARNREFFSRLEIEIGETELDALRGRNKAAHGGRSGSGDLSSYVRRVGSLRALFNRCLLRIAGVAQTYVDYSGQEVVDRNLHEPMGR